MGKEMGEPRNNLAPCALPTLVVFLFDNHTEQADERWGIWIHAKKRRINGTGKSSDSSCWRTIHLHYVGKNHEMEVGIL